VVSHRSRHNPSPPLIPSPQLNLRIRIPPSQVLLAHLFQRSRLLRRLRAVACRCGRPPLLRRKALVERGLLLCAHLPVASESGQLKAAVPANSHLPAFAPVLLRLSLVRA
jgi:hypothetical protein